MDATAAYQQQQPHNAQFSPPQQGPPPPPPSATAPSQPATYYSDNVPYDESQQRQQQQYNQPPTFQKPNINIRPLIDSDSPPQNPQSEQFPGVGFSNANKNINNINTSNTSDYAFNEDAEPLHHTSLSSSTRRMNLRYQLFLDKISPHWKARWTFSLLALGVFIARVVLSQGWYVICYGLGIYYLNLLIGFISPRVDPSLASGDDDDDDLGPMLPTNATDEFKPFIRRVPEFKFWISGTKATLIALFMTMFNLFDVPVFWPILLIYFIILFACTMRQQIKHMIRYSYVPWDSGKKKYVGRGGGGGGGSDSTTI